MEALDLTNESWIRLSPASSALHKSIIPTGTHLPDGTEQPDRIRLSFSMNKGISHVPWVAKKAVAFLRNSGRCPGRRQFISEVLGTFFQALENSLTITFLIVRDTGVAIGHPVP